MEDKEVRFIIDSMLGRLAKWLRVMGYDTHYQPVYTTDEIDEFISNGRFFITRNRSYFAKYKPSLLITSDKVFDQLHEVKDKKQLSFNLKKSFSRCLLCNKKLKPVPLKNASGCIPEYILTQNPKGVSHCSACNRYFWPGSHRKKILDQITQWQLDE